ncbi:MAG: hypothetical protein SNJ55_13390 [Chloroherpetonaceae bacterium]
MRRYKALNPITIEDAEKAFFTGEVTTVAEALLRMSLFIEDYDFIIERLMKHIKNENPEIKEASIFGIGHVARRFGKIEKDEVLPILDLLKSDEYVSGAVYDTLSDIEFFVK